jgi:hypothetical protein
LRRVVPVLLYSVVALCSCARRNVAPVAPPSPPVVVSAGPISAAPPDSPNVGKIVSPPAGVRVANVTAQITGTVSDPSGAVIPDVTVTVTDKATGRTWTTRTDSQGRYSVLGLPSSSYSVAFVQTGFQKKIIEGVTVGPEQAMTIQAELSVGTDVLVTSPAPKRGGQPEKGRVPDGTSAEQLGPVAAENEAFQDWHNSLPEGLSDHHVDPVMRLGKESSVTFTIHGPNAPAFTPAPGSMPDKLQVSPMMSVSLTQPDNPDGFKIVESDSPENPKRVAPDGTTTWTWTVTPLRLGPLNLHIAAYVLRGESGSDKASYKSYDDTIKVHSVTPWGYLMMGLVWFLNNPAASLKWILPGGAGAAMIGKLIHWALARRKKGEAGP